MPPAERKSALYGHCVEVYNAMLARSEPYDTREEKLGPIPQVKGVGLYEVRNSINPGTVYPDDHDYPHTGPTPSNPAPVATQEGPRIYTGYLTKLFKELHLSVPYYTSVMENLKRMKCVEQLKRGGGNMPSKWALWQPPDRMLFNHMQADVKLTATGVHKSTVIKILEQRIADMDEEIRRQSDRITKLEIGRLDGNA